MMAVPPALQALPAVDPNVLAEPALEAVLRQDEARGRPLACPVVCVEGFLGGGNPWYWNSCVRHGKVIIAKLGPVSSLHDRACELFYQLKGGQGTSPPPAGEA